MPIHPSRFARRIVRHHGQRARVEFRPGESCYDRASAPGDATGYATKEESLFTTPSPAAQIITDGIDTTPRLDWHQKPLKPRTAAGLSKDNRTLTLFTVDAAGDSQGMTVKEVVKFLWMTQRGFGPRPPRP